MFVQRLQSASVTLPFYKTTQAKVTLIAAGALLVISSIYLLRSWNSGNRQVETLESVLKSPNFNPHHTIGGKELIDLAIAERNMDSITQIIMSERWAPTTAQATQVLEDVAPLLGGMQSNDFKIIKVLLARLPELKNDFSIQTLDAICRRYGENTCMKLLDFYVQYPKEEDLSVLKKFPNVRSKLEERNKLVDDFIEALETTDIKKIQEIVKKNPKILLFYASDGQKVWRYALHKDEKVVKMLFVNKKVINDVDKKEFSPLTYASCHNVPTPVIQHLLDNKACISFANSEGATVAHFAATSAPLCTLKLLRKHGVDFNITKKSGLTPFMLACTRNGKDVEEVLNFLKENGADIHATDVDGCSAVHLAVFFESLNALQWLKKNGVDFNITSKDGVTPFIFACTRNGKDVEEVLNFLKENGADMHATDVDGSSAVHLAVVSGSLNALQWLKKNGVDFNITSKFGLTPFMLACTRNGKDVEEVLNFLKDNGADIHATGANDFSVFYLAAYGSSNALQWLKENGFDISWNSGNRQVETLESVLKSPNFNPHHTIGGKELIDLAIAERNMDSITQIIMSERWAPTPAQATQVLEDVAPLLGGMQSADVLKIVNRLSLYGAELTEKFVDIIYETGSFLLAYHFASQQNELKEFFDRAETENKDNVIRGLLHVASECDVPKDYEKRFNKLCSEKAQKIQQYHAAVQAEDLPLIEKLAAETPFVTNPIEYSELNDGNLLLIDRALKTGDLETIRLVLQLGPIKFNSSDFYNSRLKKLLNDGKIDIALVFAHYSPVMSELDLVFIDEEWKQLDKPDLLSFIDGLYRPLTKDFLEKVIYFQDIEVVKRVVEKRLVAVSDFKDLTWWKVASNNIKIIEFLLTEFPELKNNFSIQTLCFICGDFGENAGMKLLDFYVQYPKEKDLSELFENFPEVQEGLKKRNKLVDDFVEALKTTDIKKIQEIVEKNPKILLFYASDGQKVWRYAVHKDEKVVKMLFVNEKVINDVDKEGFSPLMYTSYNDLPTAVIRHLLDNGACIDFADSDGRTVAHVAALYASLGTLKLLRKRGANFNVTTKSCVTPFMAACQRGGKDVKEVLNFLKDNGADIHAVDVDGDSAVHLAVLSGSLNALQWLNENRVDINRKDKQGRSPLWSVFDSDSKADSNCAIIKYLIQNGANVNEIDSEGEHLFNYGIAKGKISECNALLSSSVSLEGIKPMDLVFFTRTLGFMAQELPKLFRFLVEGKHFSQHISGMVRHVAREHHRDLAEKI